MNNRRFAVALVVGVAVAAVAPAASAQDVLPRPVKPFAGKIGLRPSESVKDFPAPVTAPEGAPNVVIILTDDVGFGATSTFGGPIPTPTADRLAAAGVRYNNFHTTALCSPTRAALLTGRNHHSVSTGGIMEIGVGYPGYNTLIAPTKRGLGDILRLNGFAGVERYEVAGSAPLAPGAHTIELDFAYDGGGPGSGGDATLRIDGVVAGEARFDRTLGFRMSLDETLDVGEDTGTPVSEDYRVPFAFSGTIERVTIHLR